MDTVMVSESENDQILEGVGNDVVTVFILLVLGAVPLLYLLWKNRHRASQVIHPAQQRIVDEARRRLGILIGGGEAQEENNATENNPEDQSASNPPRMYNQDNNCPICYSQARFAVQTQCGHLFCCSCIIAYWRYGNWLGKVNCPVCRTPISILLPSFTEVDVDVPGRDEANRNIDDYNRRFSGGLRSILEYIRDIPVLIPHLFRMLFAQEGVALVFRLRIIVCLFAIVAYLLSPFDIIPEAIFGLLGLLDDFFVVFLLSIYVIYAYRNFMANRNGE